MKSFFTKRFLMIFPLILLFCTSTIISQNLVVGYFPDWLKTTLPPQSIKFENLTHIVHAFAWPQSNGNISYYQGMFNYNLADETHNAGKKILLAFGGWGQSDGFVLMAADSIIRANFIDNVVDLITENNYDGIDLDWEFPVNINQGKNLTALVKDMRERFNQENPNLLITMAVSAGSFNGQYIEYDKLVNYVDWFSMMGYDFHGSWTSHAGHNAPLYQPINCFDGASNIGIKYLTSTRQVPKERLVFGVPFYGKQFKSTGLYQPIIQPADINVKDYIYKDIVPKFSNINWNYNWDDVSKVPYLTNTNDTLFITFDDTVSIRIKCEYALDNQLAGIMIWALGQDIVGGSQPLLETIGKTLGLVTSVENLPGQIVKNFYLYDNYPNPFNPSTKIKFVIPESSFVVLKVFDILGREIEILVNEIKSPGNYEIYFNASDLSSGLYTYVLSSGNFFQSRKMILLK